MRMKIQVNAESCCYSRVNCIYIDKADYYDNITAHWQLQSVPPSCLGESLCGATDGCQAGIYLCILLKSPKALGMQGLCLLWTWMAAACPALLGGPAYHHLLTAACLRTFHDDSKCLAYFLHVPVHIAGLVRSRWSESTVLADGLLFLGCRV